MKRNSLLIIVSISFAFILLSCSDSRVAGVRNNVFESVELPKDPDMNTATVFDPDVISNWMMDGYSFDKTCKNAYVEGVNNYHLSKKWRNFIDDFDDTVEYVSSPVIFDNKVYYLSQNSDLFIFDLNTGKRLLKKNILPEDIIDNSSDKHLYSSIAIDNSGVLFLTLTNGYFISLSINSDNTPAIIWKVNLESVASSPVIYKDIVLVNTHKNILYALNKNTGNILWKFKTFEDMTMMSKIASVTVSDDKVFVTMQNLESFIFDINTGNVLGNDSLVGKSYLSSPFSFIGAVISPLVDDGIMISANTDNLISAITYRNDIKRIWSLPLGMYANPCLNNGVMFAVNTSNKLFAINVKNGKVIWNTELIRQDDDLEFYVISMLLINNNLVLNTNSGEVIFVNSITGEFMKRQKLSNGFISSMIAVENNVIAIDNDGYIVSYEYKK